MRKICLCLLLTAILSGCWDYKDLDKLSIVTGMAFDAGDNGQVTVTIEVVDRSASVKKEGLRARTVTAAGDTVGIAVREAKKQLDYALYYGNMTVAVVGKGLGVERPAEWLRSNRGVRETVYMTAAEQAGALLQGEDGGIAAFTLRDILDASEEVRPVELYKLEDRVPFFKRIGDKRPVLAGSITVKGGRGE